MRAKLRPILSLLLGLCLAWALLNTVSAADPAPASPANLEAAQPPLPPPPKSPVESFRQLLAMQPAERERALTNRTPLIRKRILEKVQHYLALKADEREVLLRMTEVEWYFSNLRQVPAANRSSQLQLVPEADRQMVASRLAIWDTLSPRQQQEVLKYMPLLTRGQGPAATPLPNGKGLENFNRKLDDWKKLPPDQRRDTYSRFENFFALNDGERERTLHVLSEPERAQMENALVRLEKMPVERRRMILAALPRLAALSDQEREDFIRNAESWQAMTPAERQTLRAFTNRLPAPPLPPPFPPTPLPATGMRNSQVSLAATNATN